MFAVGCCRLSLVERLRLAQWSLFSKAGYFIRVQANWLFAVGCYRLSFAGWCCLVHPTQGLWVRPRGSLPGIRRLKAVTLRPVFSMAPRAGYRRPRRGGNSRSQSGTSGSNHSSPRRISPLACASPPSGNSENSVDDLCNAVQTATLYYRRKKNKPVVKAMITVIFEEEDEGDGSSDEDKEERTPPSTNNSSKGKDSSYSPGNQSQMDEDSTVGYYTEQKEALQEIRGLKGKEPLDSFGDPSEVRKDSHPCKSSSPQSMTNRAESEDTFDYTLYLKLPPGLESIEALPVGMEVTWERDLVRAAEDRKKRAQEREAEAQKKLGIGFPKCSG